MGLDNETEIDTTHWNIDIEDLNNRTDYRGKETFEV